MRIAYVRRRWCHSDEAPNGLRCRFWCYLLKIEKPILYTLVSVRVHQLAGRRFSHLIWSEDEIVNDDDLFTRTHANHHTSTWHTNQTNTICSKCKPNNERAAGVCGASGRAFGRRMQRHIKSNVGVYVEMFVLLTHIMYVELGTGRMSSGTHECQKIFKWNGTSYECVKEASKHVWILRRNINHFWNIKV